MEMETQAKQRKRKATRAYLVLFTIAASAVAIYFVHGYLTKDVVSTDDAQVDADIVPIAAGSADRCCTCG